MPKLKLLLENSLKRQLLDHLVELVQAEVSRVAKDHFYPTIYSVMGVQHLTSANSINLK